MAVGQAWAHPVPAISKSFHRIKGSSGGGVVVPNILPLLFVTAPFGGSELEIIRPVSVSVSCKSSVAENKIRNASYKKYNYEANGEKTVGT